MALALDGSGALRLLLGAAATLAAGWSAGHALLPHQRPAGRWFWGALAHLAATIAVGTICYYLAAFGPGASGFVTAALPAVWALLGWRRSAPTPETVPAPMFRWSAAQVVLSLAAAALFVTALRSWFGAVTAASLRSPWEIAPRGAVLFIGLGALAALGAMRGTHSTNADDRPTHPAPSLLALMLGMVAATTVALGVYQAGYGFDPFLHRAAERIVVEEGVVTPKTPYYIGQYVLVAQTSRLTGLEVGAIDRWLLPLAAVLFVPAAYFALRGRGSSPRGATVGSAVALLVPLSSLIVTTPQGLANLLAALAVCAAFAAPSSVLALLLAFAATCSHPLSGVPILAALLALRLRGTPTPARPLAVPMLVGAAIAVPAMFALNALVSGNGIHFVWPQDGLFAFADRVFGYLPYRRHDLWYDLAYWWKAAALPLFLSAGVWAWVRLRVRWPLVIATALLVNGLILKGFARFPFLVEGEQLSYGGRLLELACLALLPVLALWVARREDALASAPGPRLALIAAIAALAAGNVYASYPHLDAYDSSRGFSTSAHDAAAARAIAADAGTASYVVLANQSAAAGAIQELGFFRYFPSRDPERPGELFAYPVPTTSPLYDLFLRLMATPSEAAAIAAEAQVLTGAERVYAIVDGYWWNAAGVRATLERQASWSTKFGDTEVRAYRLR